jgi:hypothetical protein
MSEQPELRAAASQRFPRTVAARASKVLSPSSEINRSHNTGRYAIYDEILSRSL